MADPLTQLDAATKETDVKELSDDLVRKLKVLVGDAFQMARSDGLNDPELLIKTITAFTQLRGRLAPPATSGNNYPTLNFSFVVNNEGAKPAVEVVEVVDTKPVQAITFSEDDK